jgi:hypothetical protein
MLTLLVVALPAFAQDLATASTGTTVEKSARIWRHILPLPPGKFELISRQVADNRNGYTLGEIRMMSVDNGRLDTLVFIETNRNPAGPGGSWSMNQVCRRAQRAYFKFVEETPRQHECWFAGSVTFDINETPSPAYLEFRKRTGDAGRPNVLATLVYSIGRDDEYAFVRYEFNPARWNIEDDTHGRDQNGWAKENLPRFPERQRVLQLLTDQGQALADAIKRGLKGRDPDFRWQLNTQ